jgi:hypothetical protein
MIPGDPERVRIIIGYLQRVVSIDRILGISQTVQDRHSRKIGEFLTAMQGANSLLNGWLRAVAC